MSAFSLVSIVPTAHLAALDALSAEQGRGSPSHIVPLSATGNAPATHYGLCAWASAQTRAEYTALQANHALAPIVSGHTPAAITAAIAAVSLAWADDAPGVGGQHWANTLAALGLRSVSYA